MASSLEVEGTTEESETFEISGLKEEFLAELGKLSLQLTTASHSEFTAKTKLASLASRQENTLEKLEAIERAKFENEQALKQQLRSNASRRNEAYNKKVKLSQYQNGERQKLLESLELCEKVISNLQFK